MITQDFESRETSQSEMKETDWEKERQREGWDGALRDKVTSREFESLRDFLDYRETERERHWRKELIEGGNLTETRKPQEAKKNSQLVKKANVKG